MIGSKLRKVQRANKGEGLGTSCKGHKGAKGHIPPLQVSLHQRCHLLAVNLTGYISTRDQCHSDHQAEEEAPQIPITPQTSEASLPGTRADFTMRNMKVPRIRTGWAFNLPTPPLGAIPHPVPCAGKPMRHARGGSSLAGDLAKAESAAGLSKPHFYTCLCY